MNVLIVEDEEIISKRIERFVREILGSKLISLTVKNNLEEAIYFIESTKINLLLLDLNLNNKSGFEVLNRFLSESFQTIIISAYEHNAITAFEYGVIDFIPKPFNKERLEKAFYRLFKRENFAEPTLKYLMIKKRGVVNPVQLNDILFLKGAGVYTELHLKNGHRELHSKSLENISLILPETYERIHKSYIVSKNNVLKLVIHPGGKYEILLTDNSRVPLGRSKYNYIKQKWFSELNK
ncbi:response regulator [Flavobacteriaceae bacterium AU392]|nr:DNA-binding response regulator [Flavobacteriaceae bacterium]RKM86006.1 response regulator [Flavobacteriaceae bacterium AU392]